MSFDKADFVFPTSVFDPVDNCAFLRFADNFCKDKSPVPIIG